MLRLDLLWRIAIASAIWIIRNIALRLHVDEMRRILPDGVAGRSRGVRQRCMMLVYSIDWGKLSHHLRCVIWWSRERRECVAL